MQEAHVDCLQRRFLRKTRGIAALTSWVGMWRWPRHDASVSRRARVPTELKRRPFTLDEARDVGITRHCLRGKAWKRIGTGLYRWAGTPSDFWQTLVAWSRSLPPEAVFAGATSAWIHGLDLDPIDPVDVAVPVSCGIRSRSGLIVHHGAIPLAEVQTIRHLRAVSLPLALAGICLRRPEVEALAAIDMALHLGLSDFLALDQVADAARGRPGMAKMRALALVAAPAESPMETRLRWLLMQARMPRPDVQVDLYDDAARFVGRADLYYPSARLVLEYDGGNHRDRLVEDDRRQNLLLNAGYRLLRFTGADVHSRADVVVAQVRAALLARC